MKSSTRFFPAILFLASLALGLVPALGKKGGGNPGGGSGGGDPSSPVEVPAPIGYHVTWFDGDDLGFEAPAEAFYFLDVNCYGEAVGFVRRPDGLNIAVLATATDGSLRDLNEVFAEEMAANFPAWRINHATEINANGQIACNLVPHDYPRAAGSPVVGIAVADLVAGTITLLQAEGYPWIQDLNENGDVLLWDNGDSPHSLLYVQVEPGTYTGSNLASLDAFHLTQRNQDQHQRHWALSVATIDSNLQIAFSARQDRTVAAYFYDFGATPDDAPLDLQAGLKGKVNSRSHDIGEDGTVYGENPSAEPARWTSAGGWEAFVPTIRVSRDSIDPSVLSGNSFGVEPALVHKYSDGGYFPVEVDSGDSERYELELANALWHRSISQRARTEDPAISDLDGFICGHTANTGAGGIPPAGFILTPLAPAP